MSQKEKQKKKEKADKKLKQLIRDTLPKPKRNTSSARTPDPKQRGKEKSVQNTDRQPKGSDAPIRQHNRFSTLEDMEAEESPSCRGGRVERRCWVNFQCRGVLLVWMIVGQGPSALAIGAGGGCLVIFFPHLSFLSPSLRETARYRLKYCLKGPLNPKQPTNQPIHHVFQRENLTVYLLPKNRSNLFAPCFYIHNN